MLQLLQYYDLNKTNKQAFNTQQGNLTMENKGVNTMTTTHFKGYYPREVLTEEEQKKLVKKLAKSNDLDEAETLRLARLVRKEELEWAIIRKELLQKEPLPMDCSIDLKVIEEQNGFVNVYVVKSKNKTLYKKKDGVWWALKADAIEFGKNIINNARHCGYLPV